MNTNEKGQSFEKAVARALVDYYGLSPLGDFVTIEHNVREPGRSGQAHQIDIRIVIRLGITKLKLLCECKCYNGKVPLMDVLALKSRVDDCQGAGGILITNKGFQKGAATFAKENNITLLTLRGQHITSSGGGGRIRSSDAVWSVVSRLSNYWHKPIPRNVRFSLVRDSRNWFERFLSLFSIWVDSIEFEWKGISISFYDTDFELDGEPVDFSGHWTTCLADEDGNTFSGSTMSKVLVWKTLMDQAEKEARTDQQEHLKANSKLRLGIEN